jgi:lysophospholipase L1-like esterase
MLGSAHLITALILHVALFIGVYAILGYTFKSWKTSNLRISYWVLCLGLILAEITFRFITKNHLSYMERNGSLWYDDPYSSVLESYGRFRITGDAGLMLHPTNICKTENKPEFNHEHCYNNIGVRDKNYTNVELDSNLTILTLGDSFTEGVGAPYDSTWSKLLEVKSKKIKQNTIVLNCGHNGSDVVFEWYKLEQKLLKLYRPDIVVVSINRSDIQDLIFRGGKERFKSKRKLQYNTGPWWKYLYAISHTSRFFIHNLLDVEWHYLTKEAYAKASLDATETMKQIITDALFPLAKKHDFKLLVAFAPMKYEIENKVIELQGCHDGIKIEDGSFHKCSLLDTFVTLSSTGNLTEYFWPIDLHCTSKGYEVWAEQIFHEIQKQGWLSPD